MAKRTNQLYSSSFWPLQVPGGAVSSHQFCIARLPLDPRFLLCDSEARLEIGEGRPKEFMDDASRLLVR